MSDGKKTTMNKDEFWHVIDDVNNKVGQGSQEQFLQKFREKLLEYTSEAIRDWYAIFRFYYDKAYRNDLWAACAATKSHSSDDGFIDFRYWLISKGRNMYFSAMNNPDSLAGFDIPAGSAQFEVFGYEADNAYVIQCINESGIDKEKLIESGKRFDIWEEVNAHPFSSDVVSDLQSDITDRPDINDNWSYYNLKAVVPRLYAKYNDLSLSEKLESAKNRADNEIDKSEADDVIKE